jgi:hypothetical protein
MSNCGIFLPFEHHNTNYHQHFALYFRDKKQVAQLIPSLMCNEYKKTYPNLVFQEDTLKDCFRNALKELKTNTSNEGGNEKVILQSDEVLIQLKATNEHDTHNIVKR